jgi:putative oxidoreductase
VDWKRLVQFALLGSSDLEQYAILLVRVSLGLFFAISGANKIVCRRRHENYLRNAR